MIKVYLTCEEINILVSPIRIEHTFILHKKFLMPYGMCFWGLGLTEQPPHLGDTNL